MLKYGHLEMAYAELQPALDCVIEDKGFCEWYSVKDHRPHGARDIRGVAGVLAKAIWLTQAQAHRALLDKSHDD